MKRGFIRALWGIHDHQGRRFYQRRTKIDNDIHLVLHNKYHEPFTTYVFGKDNFDYLQKRGFECKLIHDDPIVWDMDTQQFRHKFEVFQKASEDFDQFVFLDWDMMFVRPMPLDFWDTLAQKAPIQAIMRMYHRKKAFWRSTAQRQIPCGSFVYVGDKSVPSKLLEYWEKMNRPWSEELVMAKYIDDLMGGQYDGEKYWNNYEPTFFQFQHDLWPKEKMATKRVFIEHFNHHGVSGALNHLKNKQLQIDWLQHEEKKFKGV